MDGSRVTQNLDFLWFYTNILTCRNDPVPSLTDQFPPLIHAQEPPQRDLQKPNNPFLLNHQNDVENLTPRCHKCGEILSALKEERVIPSNSEVVKAGRKTDRRERRKWKKSWPNGMKVIPGGVDFMEHSWFLKFQEESYKYQMLGTQQQAKMPPFDDDKAVKQHLKSWAYAVALSVKEGKLEGGTSSLV